MAYQFTYTPDDLREAMAGAALAAGGKKPSIAGFIVWIVVAVVGMLWIAMVLLEPAPVIVTPAPTPTSGDGTLQVDVVVLLLPQISIGLLIVLIVIVGALAKRRARKHLRSSSRSRFSLGMVLFNIGWFLIIELNLQLADGNITKHRVRLSAAQTLCVEYLPWFGMVVPLMAYLIYLARRRHLQRWKKCPSYLRGKLFDFDDEHFSLRDDAVSRGVRWSSLVRYGESASLLLVYNEDGEAWMIPKRIFPDADALIQIKRIISDQIPVGKFLNELTGFPVIPRATMTASAPE